MTYDDWKTTEPNTDDDLSRCDACGAPTAIVDDRVTYCARCWADVQAQAELDAWHADPADVD